MTDRNKTLTDKGVERLRAGTYWDRQTPGLSLRVSPDGRTRSWAVAYRVRGQFVSNPATGKKTFPLRRLYLGRWPHVGLAQARDDARRVVAEARSGADPQALQAERDRQAEEARAASDRAAAERGYTLAVLCDRYIERRAKQRNRTWRDTQATLKNHVLPKLGARPAVEVTRRDVQKLLNDLETAKGFHVARLSRAALSAAMQWAAQQDEIAENVARQTRLSGRAEPRDRALHPAELLRAWNAAGKMDKERGALLKLLILTGCRRNEIGNLRFEWLRLNQLDAHFEIPQSFYKSKKAHVVPLSAAARAALAAVLPESIPERGRIFPAHSFNKLKRTLDKLMLAEMREQAAARGEDPDKVEFVPFRLHDLRRTARTGMSALGVNPIVCEAVIGHALPGLIKTYDRYSYTKEKREALEMWGNHVLSLGNPKSNIIHLPPKEIAHVAA